MPHENRSDKESFDRFMRLYSESQLPMLAFIRTLVFGWANAEEVLQETNITIWEKREDFDLDTNFMHWAKRIAYYKVLQFREKSQKNRFLSNETMEYIASDMIKAETEAPDPESEALENCIKKLSEKDRDLLRQRYFEEANVKSISQAMERSPRTIQASLQRIRNSLRICIQRSLAMEGRES